MIYFLLFEAKFLILIALNTLVWLPVPVDLSSILPTPCSSPLSKPTLPPLPISPVPSHSPPFSPLYSIYLSIVSSSTFLKFPAKFVTPCLFSIVFRFPFSRQFCCVRPPSWIIIPSLNHTGIPLMHYFQLCLDSRRQGWDDGSYISLVTKNLNVQN